MGHPSWFSLHFVDLEFCKSFFAPPPHSLSHQPDMINEIQYCHRVVIVSLLRSAADNCLLEGECFLHMLLLFHKSPCVVFSTPHLTYSGLQFYHCSLQPHSSDGGYADSELCGSCLPNQKTLRICITAPGSDARSHRLAPSGAIEHD